MENIIIILILAIIVTCSGIYIYKAKKSGKKCIGCSCGCDNNKNCDGCK